MAKYSKEEIFKKLETIRDLPTLPEVLERLRKATRDPHADAVKVAHIIEDDPSMMTRILKVVNSPLYAGTEKILTLQLAIARVGLNAINNIALSTSVFSFFGTANQKDFDRKEFWKHSISTGIAVDILYDRYKANLRHKYEKDLLHLTGLVHDIGKIIFEQYFHDDFLSAIQSGKDLHIPLFNVELEQIGADHAQIGAWLGERWNLSDEIVNTIRWHHEPDNVDDQYLELVMLCHAANYICNLVRLGDSGDVVAPAFFRGVWKRLGVDVEDLSVIIDQVKEQSKHSELLLAFVK